MTALTDDVRRMVEADNVGHVATLLPDGAPHSVPVWIGMEGDRLAFLTSPGSRKARNLAGDPRVAVSIADRRDPHAGMAQIRGRVVEVVDGERGWAIIDRLSQQYVGAPYPLREDRVVYLVEPERAWSMAFS